MGIANGGYTTNMLGAAYGDTSTNYNSGFSALALGTIREMNTALFAQKDTNRLQMLTNGLYAIDLWTTRSDLPANQQYTLGYNVNDDSNQNHSWQAIAGQYGWNQSGGPNLSKFPFAFSAMHRFNVNDYLYFYINTDDGPRTYVYNWRVIKISN